MQLPALATACAACAACAAAGRRHHRARVEHVLHDDGSACNHVNHVNDFNNGQTIPFEQCVSECAARSNCTVIEYGKGASRCDADEPHKCRCYLVSNEGGSQSCNIAADHASCICPPAANETTCLF